MYDALETGVMRADMWRYTALYLYGGVYADLDIQCFKPFAPLLRGVSTLLSYKAGANFSRGASNSLFGSLSNAVFASELLCGRAAPRRVDGAGRERNV